MLTSIGQSSRLITLGFGLFLGAVMNQPILALPQGGVVSGGSAAISTSGNTTTINQSSQNAIIDWQSFDVAAGELVKFNQPNSSAAALNRIHNQLPSQIFGNIEANGRVFLINPRGVIFGAGSRVNVGSLFVTTLSITNNDFMNGNYKFTLPDGTQGSIINRGMIEAATGGTISFVGNNIVNEGTVVASLGQVNLVAADEVSVDFDGDGLINFQVDKAVLSNDTNASEALKNTGTLSASGGQVLMNAQVASAVFTNAVNNEGIVEANGIQEVGGVITILGNGGDIRNTGTLLAKGDTGDGGTILVETDATNWSEGSAQIDASSTVAQGGTVHLLGKQVGLFNDTYVNVSGATGGGTVLAGGDYQGKGTVQNAESTAMTSNAIITADATDNGDGGTVILWADDTTVFHGNISATGGSQGGDGGFVETSGKIFLEALGSVDASAVYGKAGAWLLDPSNVSIADAASSNGAFDSGTPNTFTPTGDSAVADRGTIQTSLAAGTSVTIVTTSGQAQAGNITLDDSIVVTTSSGDVTLTLNAENDIIIDDVITASGTNELNIVLNADSDNSGASGGAITINAGNTLTSNNGDITLDGDAITLTTTAALAAGSGDILLSTDAIALGNSNTITTTGTVTIQPETAGTAIGIGDAAGGALNFGDSELGAITDGASKIIIGLASTGSGGITVDKTGTSTLIINDDLELLSPAGGSITINDAISLPTSGDTLRIDGSGATTLLNANITTNNASIEFDDAVQVASANITVDTGTGAGAITFDGAVDAEGAEDTNTLELKAGTGVITFTGAVGSTEDFNLTITSADSVDFDNTAALNTLTLTDTDNNITFDNTTSFITLTTAAQGYNLFFNGATTTVTNDAIFAAITGTVNFGNSGDTLTFNGGIDTTAVVGTVNLGGNLVTSGDQMDLGAITLTANSTLDTGTSANIDMNVGDVTGAGFTLGVDAGADAGSDITIASLDNVSTFTVTDSGDTTITGTTGAGTAGAVVLTDTTGDITFGGNTSITTLTHTTGGYDLFLNGGTTTITNDVTFAATAGDVNLGNGADTLNFNGGIDTTAVTGTVNIGGNVVTSDDQMDLGAITLTANSTLDTGTAATSIMNVGAVTGAGFSLGVDSGSNAAANITITSLDNVSTFTVTDSGGLTVTGTTGAGTAGAVVLTDTTDGEDIIFGGNTSITTLTTQAEGYDLFFNGGSTTVTNDATFAAITGTLNLGNSGDTLTFNGGIDTTAVVGTVNLGGNLVTSGDQMDLGAITLTANSTLDTGTAATSIMNVGAVTGGGFTLGVDSGSNALANITIASLDDVSTFTVTDSGGLTVTGTTGAGTAGAVVLTDTTDGEDIIFGGNTSITTLTTQAQGYDLFFNGGTTTITNDVTFAAITANGSLNLGNGGDTLNFNGGIDTTAVVGTVNIGGNIVTSDDQMDLGAITLTANSTLDTGTAATSIMNVGAVTGGGFSLLVDSGADADSDITIASLDNVSTFTVRDSGDTTITGTTGAGTAGAVVLTDTTGDITFGGNTSITTLTHTTGGYDLFLNGGTTTITNDVTFAATAGDVNLGNGGDTLNFNGGIDTTAVTGTVNIGGNIVTSDDQMDLGAITLTANSTLDTGTAATSIMNVGAVTGAGFSLGVDSGSNAAANITIASLDNVSTFTVTDSGGLTVTGNVGQGTAGAVVLTDTTDGEDIIFAGDTAITTLTTQAEGYDLFFNGATTTITNDATFAAISGSLNLGNSGDTLNFNGGIDTTAVTGTVNIGGNIITTGDDMDFGAITLTANSVLDSGTSANIDIDVGAVTGGGFSLLVDSGADADSDITIASLDNVSTFTVRDSGDTTITGTTGAGTAGAVVLTDTTGDITFGGNTSITTLTHTTGGYDLFLNGGTTTITNDVTFAATAGDVNLGNGGDTLNFNGGIDTTAVTGTVNIGGNVVTSDDQMDLGAITLTANSTLDTGTAATSIMNVGAVTGGGFSLGVDSGSNAAANITITSLDNVSTFTVTDSGGLTVTGTTGAGTPGAVVLTDTTDGEDIIFAGDTAITTLTTAAEGYDLFFNGATTTITNDVTFAAISGSLNLGNSGDTLNFNGGIDTTAVTGTVNIGGNIITTGDDMDFGAITLTANSVLDSGTSANIDIDVGAVTGGGFSLLVDSGADADSDITIASLDNVSTFTVRDSGDTTITGTTGAGTAGAVVLTDTTGDITFGGNTSITTLTHTTGGYDLLLNGGTTTITNDVTFAATAGDVNLGNGGDTLNFNGGIDTTAVTGTVNIGGNVVTTGDDMDLGAITLIANSSLDTGTSANIDIDVGAVTGGGFSLLVDSGADAGSDITIASLDNVSIFTVRDSGGTTITGNVGQGTAGAVVLTDTTDGEDIIFAGDTAITTLTTQAEGYDLFFNGTTNSVTNDATFAAITGTVNFGNADSDTITFTGGVDTTAVTGTVNIAGNFDTTDTDMDLGAITLTANADIDSGNAATSTMNIGAVTGAGFTLDVDSGTNTAADIVITSLDNVSTFTLRDSGGLNVTGNVGQGTAGAVVLTDTTAGEDIIFGGNTSITTLTTQAEGYDLFFNGGTTTITNDVTFAAIAGTLNLGNGGDNLTFNGGIDTTAVAGTVNIGGNVVTSGDDMDFGAITLSANSTLDSGTSANIDIDVGAVTGAGFSLLVDSGADTGSDITIASLDNVSTFTVRDSGGTTITGNVGQGTAGAVVLTDTTDGEDIIFAGDTAITTLTTASEGYDLFFNGTTNSVTNDATFAAITGTVNFGNSSGDTITFTGGVDTTAVTGTVNIAGNFDTTNTDMDLGAITLTGNADIDTGTGATSTMDIGAVTGGGFTLDVDSGSNAAANITIASLDNVSTFTVRDSGGLTVTGTTGAGTAGAVVLTDTTDGEDIIFAGNTSITTLTTAAEGYDLFLNGATTTITNDATFAAITGTLNLGNGGDTLNFNGGIDTTAVAGTVNIGGNIITTSDQMDLGAITLSANSTLDTGTAANVDMNVGAVTGAGFSLLVDTGADAGSDITIASLDNVSTFTVRDSGGITVTGTVGQGTAGAVVLTDTTDGEDIIFAGNTAITTLTTAAEGYDLFFNGTTNTVTNDTTFAAMTGTLNFGNAATDGITFNGGVDTTAVTGTVNVAGGLNTSGDDMDLGAITLTANADIDTGTAATSTMDIGAITGGGFTLAVDSGDNAAADITIASIDNVSTFTVRDSGGTTITGTIGKDNSGAVTITDTTGAVTFGGNAVITTLTTAANGYSTVFNGSTNTITADTTFLNTGGITFGDSTSDSTTFTGGLDTQASTTTTQGTVSTTNTQLDTGVLVLANDTTLSSGSGALNLNGTTNDTTAGTSDLNLNSSGVTTIGGVVGGTATLKSLTTDSVGSTVINANINTSGNTMTFNDATTISTSGLTLTDTSGGIVFNNTLNIGSTDTTLVSDVLSFNGAVSGNSSGKLTLLTNTTNATSSDVNVVIGSSNGTYKIKGSSFSDFEADLVIGGRTTGTVTSSNLTVEGGFNFTTKGDIVLLTTNDLKVSQISTDNDVVLIANGTNGNILLSQFGLTNNITADTIVLGAHNQIGNSGQHPKILSASTAVEAYTRLSTLFLDSNITPDTSNSSFLASLAANFLSGINHNATVRNDNAASNQNSISQTGQTTQHNHALVYQTPGHERYTPEHHTPHHLTHHYNNNATPQPAQPMQAKALISFDARVQEAGNTNDLTFTGQKSIESKSGSDFISDEEKNDSSTGASVNQELNSESEEDGSFTVSLEEDDDSSLTLSMNDISFE